MAEKKPKMLTTEAVPLSTLFEQDERHGLNSCPSVGAEGRSPEMDYSNLCGPSRQWPIRDRREVKAMYG